MSLFKDGLMRKPNKSILRNALLTIKVDVHPTALHVLDGGALLHKVRWNANSAFEKLCLQYVNQHSTVCEYIFKLLHGKHSIKHPQIHWNGVGKKRIPLTIQ